MAQPCGSCRVEQLREPAERGQHGRDGGPPDLGEVAKPRPPASPRASDPRPFLDQSRRASISAYLRRNAARWISEQLDSCATLGYSRSVHESLPGFLIPDDEHVRRAADAFRLLADPTRIKILWALLQGETSVACLADLVNAAPTAVSQHLSKLRLAGLVRGRRQGTFVYYAAGDEHVRRLLAEALFHAGGGGRAIGHASDGIASETSPVRSGAHTTAR